MDYQHFSAEDFARDAFFIRWVKGDPETQWFWSTFLSEHPSKAGDIAEAREMVALLVSSNEGEPLDNETRESMRKHLLMTLNARRERDKEYGNSGNPFGLTGTRFWLSIAASLTLIVSVVAIWQLTAPSKVDHPIAQIVDDSVSKLIFADSTEQRISHRGQKSLLLLADGTKVWLNADTRLTYPKDFAHRDLRVVYLDGEAFFDVVSDPKKPFIVYTRDLNIQVLGTSFNVKSYADDTEVETTLAEGRVEIDKRTESAKNEKIILKPNQKATFSRASKHIEVREVAPDEISTWRSNRLVFRSEPLSEVIKQLERWYNVRFHVTNPADLSCPLTANIEKESLKEVLDLLAVTHNISYTIDGQEVFIKGSICH